MRLLLAVALTLTTYSVMASDFPTCQQVIDAGNDPAMQEEVRSFRPAFFKSAAIHQAQQLNDGLEKQGLVNAYQMSLEAYESRFAPAREHAEKFWMSLEKQHGGMAGAFAAVCDPRDMDIGNFYILFYGIVLDQMK